MSVTKIKTENVEVVNTTQVKTEKCGFINTEYCDDGSKNNCSIVDSKCEPSNSNGETKNGILDSKFKTEPDNKETTVNV